MILAPNPQSHNNALSIAPNPAIKGSEKYTFYYNTSGVVKVNLSVYDAVGNLVFKKDHLGNTALQMDLRNTSISIDIGSYLAVLIITHSNGTVDIKKVIFGIKNK